MHTLYNKFRIAGLYPWQSRLTQKIAVALRDRIIYSNLAAAPVHYT